MTSALPSSVCMLPAVIDNTDELLLVSSCPSSDAVAVVSQRILYCFPAPSISHFQGKASGAEAKLEDVGGEHDRNGSVASISFVEHTIPSFTSRAAIVWQPNGEGLAVWDGASLIVLFSYTAKVSSFAHHPTSGPHKTLSICHRVGGRPDSAQVAALEAMGGILLAVTTRANAVGIRFDGTILWRCSLPLPTADLQAAYIAAWPTDTGFALACFSDALTWWVHEVCSHPLHRRSEDHSHGGTSSGSGGGGGGAGPAGAAVTRSYSTHDRDERGAIEAGLTKRPSRLSMTSHSSRSNTNVVRLYVRPFVAKHPEMPAHGGGAGRQDKPGVAFSSSIVCTQTYYKDRLIMAVTGLDGRVSIYASIATGYSPRSQALFPELDLSAVAPGTRCTPLSSPAFEMLTSVSLASRGLLLTETGPPVALAWEGSSQGSPEEQRLAVGYKHRGMAIWSLRFAAAKEEPPEPGSVSPMDSSRLLELQSTQSLPPFTVTPFLDHISIPSARELHNRPPWETAVTGCGGLAWVALPPAASEEAQHVWTTNAFAAPSSPPALIVLTSTAGLNLPTAKALVSHCIASSKLANAGEAALMAAAMKTLHLRRPRVMTFTTPSLTNQGILSGRSLVWARSQWHTVTLPAVTSPNSISSPVLFRSGPSLFRSVRLQSIEAQLSRTWLQSPKSAPSFARRDSISSDSSNTADATEDVVLQLPNLGKTRARAASSTSAPPPPSDPQPSPPKAPAKDTRAAPAATTPRRVEVFSARFGPHGDRPLTPGSLHRRPRFNNTTLHSDSESDRDSTTRFRTAPMDEKRESFIAGASCRPVSSPSCSYVSDVSFPCLSL